MKKYSDWRLYNFVTSIIKEEMSIDETVYLDTDNIEVEVDGDTVIYYIPVEYGHELVNIKFIIYPDFIYKVSLY